MTLWYCRHGVDVNSRSLDGSTALGCATEYLNTHAMELLLDGEFAKADPNQTSQGVSPLGILVSDPEFVLCNQYEHEGTRILCENGATLLKSERTNLMTHIIGIYSRHSAEAISKDMGRYSGILVHQT